MNTPEFLVWAIEFKCPIRGFQDGSNPEKIERQLRAARAVSDGRREGRVFEGLCVNPPNAFRIDDAFAIYGGLPIVDQHCPTCPANATIGSLAGCFGLFPLSDDRQPFHLAVNSAIDRLDLASDYARLFMPTQPGWYGLWTASPLKREQLCFLQRLCEALGFNSLLAGLQTALNANLAFHANLFPAGNVAGPWWRHAPHCPRCIAPWPPNDSRKCSACGYVGRAAPERKRHARGRRPYFPIEKLLGEEAAAEFLVRYQAFQKQTAATAPAQSPPRAAQPDNPPAD